MLRRHFFRRFLPLVALISSTRKSWARGRQINSGSWFEVRELQGKVIYQSGDRRLKAWVGLQFNRVGDVFETARDSAAVLVLQSGIGTVYVNENTRFSIQRTEKTPKGGIITEIFVSQGQVQFKVRSFNNPGSRLEVITPSGLAGVRGTDFGVTVQTGGKTSLATRSGLVALTAQQQTVAVAQNQQSLIIPQEPPTSPEPLRNDTGLAVDVARLEGDKVRFIGRVDPVNLLLIQDEPQNTGKTGAFNYLISQGQGKTIQVKVITPLGEKRKYELIVVHD